MPVRAPALLFSKKLGRARGQGIMFLTQKRKRKAAQTGMSVRVAFLAYLYAAFSNKKRRL